MKGPYLTILVPFLILTVKNQLTLCYDPPPPFPNFTSDTNKTILCSKKKLFEKFV